MMAFRVRIPSALSVLISVLAFLLSYGLYDCWYEDFEYQYEVIVSGVSRLYFLGDLSFLVNHHVQHFYLFLYKLSNTIGWRAWVFTLVTCYSISVMMHSVLLSDLKWQRRSVGVALLLTTALPHFTFLNYTRVSSLAVVAGWMLYTGMIKGLNLRNQIVGLALIIFGTLTRNESAVMGTMLVGIVLILMHGSLVSVLARTWLPALFMTVYLGSNAYQVSKGAFYFHAIEPEVEYCINVGSEARVLPLGSMGSYKDSLRYKFAMSWHVEDSVNISPQFLRSIIDPDRTYLRDFGHIVDDVSNQWLSRSWPSVCALLLGWFCLIFWGGHIRCTQDTARAVLLVAGLTVVLLIPVVTIRAVPRVQDPLITSAFALSWSYFSGRGFSLGTLNPFLLIGSYAVAALLLIAHFVVIDNNLVPFRSAHDDSRRVLTTLDEKYSGYYLYPVEGMTFLRRPAFETGYFSSHPILLPGLGQMTYVPETRRFIEGFYPCDFYNYGCRFEHLKRLRPGVLFIGAEIETFYTDYLAAFYQVDFRLEKVMCLYDDVWAYRVITDDEEFVCGR
jgi:hypothetical protein